MKPAPGERLSGRHRSIRLISGRETQARLPLAIPIALLATAAALASAHPPLAAQKSAAARTVPLDTLVARATAYAAQYRTQFTSVVAEEHYVQALDVAPDVVVSGLGPTRRVIKSDFVLTRLDNAETWIAYRDAFEVDGEMVRDRTDRLVALLSADGTDGWRRAAAIANESARFNLGSRLVTRNVNVPTFVLELLHERNRRRFRFSLPAEKRGAQADNGDLGRDAGVALRTIEYRERERPTLVRQQSGADQPLQGTITIDPESGEIWRTHMAWERGPSGFVDVTFGRVAGIDVLVPFRMTEAYRSSPSIRGEATYSNFRRFETSGRVVPR